MSNPIPVRIDEDLQKEIDSLANATGLSKVDIMRMLLKAGAEAIKRNGGKFVLPLALDVRQEEEALSAGRKKPDRGNISIGRVTKTGPTS
jgi:antitoxin component of RelBE/YafQ-DinJ toxin-antitoxin module